MADAPIACRWDGEAMVPLNPYWAKRADQQWTVGEVYPITAHQDRSMRSHNRYFAMIADAWANLPEHLASEYPSAEHLRKKMLVATGYADERSIVCASKAEAQRVAAFIKPMDDYAVVTVSGPVVRVYTAQSQSMKAMGRKVFQESVQAVEDRIDALLGVASGETARNHAA